MPGEKSPGTGADGKRNFKVNEEVASDIERIRQRNKEDDARRHALNIRRHELEAEYNEKYPRKNIPEFTTSDGDKVVMTDRGRMVYGPDGTRYTANNFPEKREDALKEYEAATRPEMPFEDYVRENYPDEVAVLRPEAWDQRVVKSPVEMLQEHWSNVEKLADGRKRSDAIRHNNQLIYQSMREALARVEKAFELQNEREHKDFAEQTAAAMQTGVGAAAQYARGVETDFRRALQTEMTRLAKTLLSGQNGVDQKTVQTLLSQMRDVQNIRTVADARMIVNGVYNAIMESRCRAAAGEIEKSLKVRGKDTSAAGGAKIQNVDEYHAKTMKGIAERMKAKPTADELNAEKAEIQKRLATFDKPVEEMSEIEKQKYNEEIRKMNEIDMYESYQDTVDYWDAEVRRLKEQRKSAKGKGAITAIDESINEKLHSKLKAMGEFTDLVNGFREEGVAGKKSFVEKEEELRRAIDHDIRSDLFGVAPKTTDVKSGIGLGWVSNLNDIMKFLGRRNATGRGRLWERFVGGHMKAIDTRQIGTEQANDKLNAIAKKYGFKSYARMAAKAARMKGATVQFDEAMLNKNGNLEKDEEGEIRYKKVDKKLTVDKLLYIHAVAKMADGRVKLDRMGIDEDVVKEIRDFLDSNEKTKAMRQALDEVQDKLLTELRDKYNVTHRKLFGVGMNEVENYFPIRINQYERNTNEDISMQSDVMPSDMTGAIKKRVSNTHSLDLERGNAFTVVLEHIMEMETWNAFAPFKKEANMLLNNQTLKTKLNSMQGIFGKGEALYTHLENNLKIAAEIYRPKKNTKHDVSNWLIRFSKGIIGRAINFNLHTATKQLTSVFAMLGNADVQDVVKTVGTLPHAIYWCSKNLPAYRYRWNSGDMGYAELKRINNPESRAGKVIDWIQDHAAKVGMAPNRMIDMGICAMVARSAYFTKFREYKKAGLSKEDAHNRAIIDAEVAFNESQQSSLGAYMSEIQSRRSVMSVLATTYRNSPMSYGRLVADSITNLARQVARPKDMIAQSEKVWIERGVTPEDAKKAAVRDYLKGYVRNMTTIASVHMMTLAWNRMHNWLYGVLFDDKEQKEENIENAEWLTYADDLLQWIPIIGPMADTVITNIQHVVPLKNAILRAWKRHDFTALKGALEDINTNTMLMEEFVKAATPIMSGDFTTFTYNGINFLFSLGAGINPALVSDVVMGAFEASQYDPNECKRNWMVAAAILHSPRNSTDQYFVDRLRKALGEEYRENASLTKDGKLSIDSYIEGNPEAEQVMKEFIEYCKTKKLGFMKLGAEVTDEYLDAEAERERAFKEAKENGDEITDSMLPKLYDRTASVVNAEAAARKRMQRMVNNRNELHQRRGESDDNREATKKY